MIQLSNDIYGLTIPENAIFELVQFSETKAWIRWYLSDYSDNGNIDLPPGTWKIIGTSDEMTEEKAKTMVGRSWVEGHDIVFYENYQTEYCDLNTALESFNSLLASKNLKGRVLIIKKV